jgi:pyruvate ferredoxin oxidoreductase beta subunit
MSNHLFSPGHTACAGCGQSLAVRLVLDTAGKNTIVANNTGCLEVFSTKYPESSWEVPFIHSLFENAAAVASGVEAALIYLGKKDTINVIAEGGDGGTADIGLQALSGMWERGHDILYVCYDNEAYMNTGIQRSGLTPFSANTTTSPKGDKSFGNLRPKKPMPEIALAHGIPYVATATIGFPQDLQRKVKKAISIKGPKYIQIHVPCPLGWQYAYNISIEVGKLAVETGLFPLIEYENGKLTGVRKITPKPVQEYLKIQGRFKHLLNNPEELKKIQDIADANIAKYGLKAEPQPENPPAA